MYTNEYETYYLFFFLQGKDYIPGEKFVDNR